MNTWATPPNPETVGFFTQTVWSTVLKAKGGEAKDSQAALERLLARYRRPIFLHILASLPLGKRTQERAEDLTQEFFCQCLRLDFLKQVTPEQGRFRSFVKACVRNFLRDQHVRDTAQKRGGGQLPASLDEIDDEGRPLIEPSSPGVPPEDVLDREWALSVVDHAMQELKEECYSARRGELFEALRGHLGQAPELGSAREIGARLGMSEGAVHTAMNRLRGRLGELVTADIRQTVGTEGDWREELRYLIDLLGR